MKKTKRFCWEVHPVAAQENICAGACYRFAVLTGRLLRLEYDPAGVLRTGPANRSFIGIFLKIAFP